MIVCYLIGVLTGLIILAIVRTIIQAVRIVGMEKSE